MGIERTAVKTAAIFFPFDLFGSAGAAAGVELLADAVREMLADNRRERLPTRSQSYSSDVRIREVEFKTIADYDDWRKQGRQIIRRALANNEFILWITGNHLGTLPLYDELAEADDEPLVVQFDAHLDIYNLSDCTNELSHGNFLLSCAGPLPELINCGHRELVLKPDYIARYYRTVFSAAELAIDPEPALRRLKQAGQSGRRVVIDLDCDVFDPAFFPAVAQPLPFGLSPRFVLRLMDAIWSERVCGLSISEFCPARDREDRSLATLLWLVEYLLLRRYENARD